MELRDIILQIGAGFAEASALPLAGHPLAGIIRGEVPSEFARILSPSELTFMGSPGQGNWAEVPWMGFFHPEITDSATHGFYGVYLFAADLSAVYLCLGQGVTQLRSEFRRSAKDEMLRRAALIRDRVPEFAAKFKPGPISLGGSTQLSKDYDTAVAFHKAYPLSGLPTLEQLEDDLKEMVRLYQLLIGRGGTDNVDTAIELNPDGIRGDVIGQIEERRRYVRHARIERSSNAARKAKATHGYICQGCGFDFEKVYGDQGHEFIEAHHLIPLHSLVEGESVSMDPHRDFAVLCSNCHRMVHRSSPCLTMSQLRELPGLKISRTIVVKTGPSIFPVPLQSLRSVLSK